ncbi:hypothetical protein C1752_01134 [Acaryochloris thomasi RCC1774]|uniref:DUF928 domain-containing protein n=1 Tax=Acaryochloris thomasi RCC1774 TaxID=1764569 RepID=A0A2W1JLN8_9CYAN|nr:hypothetical protein [Acaryochloris thomasi]PZD74283.1 hypothetical protein C1752_01134 [Acaryochloris thomasi RCC1774]
MDKNRGLLLALLLVVGGAELGAAQPKKEDSNSKPRPVKVQNQKSSSKSRSLIKGIIHVIFGPLKKKPKLGSRSNLCAITPGRLGETDTIWSDRPIFSWRGKAKKLQLLDEETGELLWQRTLSGEEQSVAYDGPALNPGQVYEWRISNGGTQRSTFEVMSAEKRAKVIADLRNLNNPEEVASLTPEVRLAVSQSQYFGEQRLWSDALQSLYGVQESTDELQATLDRVLGKVCGVAGNERLAEDETIAMP